MLFRSDSLFILIQKLSIYIYQHFISIYFLLAALSVISSQQADVTDNAGLTCNIHFIQQRVPWFTSSVNKTWSFVSSHRWNITLTRPLECIHHISHHTSTTFILTYWKSTSCNMILEHEHILQHNISDFVAIRLIHCS